MSEIEKMKKYIERTKIKSKTCDTRTGNLLALCKELDIFSAVHLAFQYGRAKGYRAAKAEGRARA